MKKCLILGSGGHCRSLLSILQEKTNDYRIAGIVDTQAVTVEEIILGVRVIGAVDELSFYRSKGITSLFLAIGDNKKRAQYYNQAEDIGFELPNLIADTAHIEQSAMMGQGNLVCQHAHLGPMSRIGNGNIINTGAILEHESTVGDFSHLAPSSVISGRSRLGNFVFLGVNATVLDKITICNSVMIGGGAVITRSISEAESTYVGVPARKVE